MGCMGSHNNVLDEHIPTHLPTKRRLSPQELSNGVTFIPIDYMTGEYCPIYPEWLSNDISPTQYSIILSKLNDLSIHTHERTQFHDQLSLLLMQINATLLNPLGVNAHSASTWKGPDSLPSDIGLIIERIHIRCDLSPFTDSMSPDTPWPDEEEGHLVIFPIYEYENTENDEEYYEDTYDSYDDPIFPMY
eukprot:470840_1